MAPPQKSRAGIPGAALRLAAFVVAPMLVVGVGLTLGGLVPAQAAPCPPRTAAPPPASPRPAPIRSLPVRPVPGIVAHADENVPGTVATADEYEPGDTLPARVTPEAGADPSAGATPTTSTTPPAEATPTTSATPPTEATPSASATPPVEATPTTSTGPSASASPSAGADPSAGAPGGGTPPPSGAPEGVPCLGPGVHLSAPADPVRPRVSLERGTLTGSSLVMTRAVYRGVAELSTSEGVVPALQFDMDEAVTTAFRLTVPGKRGPATVITSRRLTASGHVHLYTTRFTGRLLGVPVTFTAEQPPPLTLPVLAFTDVVIELTLVQSDDLTGDGLTTAFQRR